MKLLKTRDFFGYVPADPMVPDYPTITLPVTTAVQWTTWAREWLPPWEIEKIRKAAEERILAACFRGMR